ncbi:MAG: hypothetical protein ACYSU0_20475 [Planctomycetota bacterium]|jgi:hypothetical protein
MRLGLSKGTQWALGITAGWAAAVTLQRPAPRFVMWMAVVTGVVPLEVLAFVGTVPIAMLCALVYCAIAVPTKHDLIPWKLFVLMAAFLSVAVIAGVDLWVASLGDTTIGNPFYVDGGCSGGISRKAIFGHMLILYLKCLPPCIVLCHFLVQLVRRRNQARPAERPSAEYG